MTTDTNAAIVQALANVAAGAAPRAAPNGKILFALSEPVTFNGEVFKDFAYRKPTGRDMRAWMNSRKGGGDDMLDLMVNLSELPSAFFDIVTGADFMAFANELQPFLNGARKILKT